MMIIRFDQICILLVKFVLVDLSNSNIISVPPVNTNGCYGGKSIFNCQSERNDIKEIHWRLEDNLIASDDVTISPDNTDTNLTIIGLLVNNGVLVSCHFYTEDYYYDSKSAIFTVSDIPPIEDLAIDMVNNNTVMIVTWRPPSCIPVFPEYRISITNDDVDNYTVTDTTKNTQYNLTVDPDLCTCINTNYTVSVLVIDAEYTHFHSNNTVGRITVNITKDSRVDIAVDNIEVTFMNRTSCYIDITLSFLKSCHTPHFSKVYVFVTSWKPLKFKNKKVNIAELIPKDNLNVSLQYKYGPVNRRFLGVLKVKYENHIKDQKNISTFNVQNLTIGVLPNNLSQVDLICYFARGSLAEGCVVTYNNSKITILKLSDQDIASETVTIQSGIVHFNAYDVVQGHTSNVAAVLITFNITYDYDLTRPASSHDSLSNASATGNGSSEHPTHSPPSSTAHPKQNRSGYYYFLFFLILIPIPIIAAAVYWGYKKYHSAVYQNLKVARKKTVKYLTKKLTKRRIE